MTTKDTGGPAFPCPTLRDEDGEVVASADQGMTLRDYFAAKVMQARINAAWTAPGPSKTAFKEWQESLPPDLLVCGFHDYLALAAYAQADAMLKAREQ